MSDANGTGGVKTQSVATVTGATNGIEVQTATLAYEWLSQPLLADVTIAGTVTCNLWACESNMSANVAINAVVDRISGTDQAITQILKTARTTEVAVSADLSVRAVNNFTATPTSTLVKKGDRLRFRVFADDAGTMAATYTWAFSWNGSTNGADGYSFISFTETLTFDVITPTGTRFYLTDTASAVSVGTDEREAWTSRGGSSANSVTSTAAGWTSPIQLLRSGATLEWYTRPLDPFTLGGLASANVRASVSNAAANCGLRITIYVCANDGSSPVAWATGCNVPTYPYEIPTTDTAIGAYPSGADVAVTAGQRLLIRLYLEDPPDVPMVTGHTATITYNGPSANAAGDSYVTIGQTVYEEGMAPRKARPPQAKSTAVMRASVH